DVSSPPEAWGNVIDGPLVATTLEAVPIASDKTSSWSVMPKGMADTIKRICGSSTYVARIGAHSGGAAGVYWVDVQKRDRNRVLISNRWDAGRNKYNPVTMSVEAQLLRPLARGRDVQRWIARPSLSILIPYEDINDGRAISEARMKREFPRTFEYFETFKP